MFLGMFMSISKILGVAYFETSTEVDSNYLLHMSWI